MRCVLSAGGTAQVPGLHPMSLPQPQRGGPMRHALHAQSAVGAGESVDAGTDIGIRPLATERSRGAFRFWHDERRFKGDAERCLVQEQLFAVGGIRTGGWPKASPIPGPLGWQRPGDWDMLWSPARTALRAASGVRPGQLVSAVPGLFALTKKRRLPTTLAAAYGEAAWQLVPRSFSLPGDIAAWRLWLDERAAAGENPGPWMLKTAQHLGRGLTLLPGESAHAAALAPRPAGSKPHVLAQRYISDPLLINGCKFGLRLWVLVSGLDPFTAYLHGQGLVLFSTDSYDSGKLSDGDGAAARGHITNYALNRDGEVWTLPMLREHLGTSTYHTLWSKLVGSAAHVACAAMGEARAEQRRSQLPPDTTFELLGLDYLIDTSLHPWLLEVNGTPSLAVDHSDPTVEARIRDTKGALVRDMVSLLGCRTRFLARYRQDKSVPNGGKSAELSGQHGSASVTTPALRRVQMELRQRGGFIPLMGHFPVPISSSSSTIGSASTNGNPCSSTAGDRLTGSVNERSTPGTGVVALRFNARDRQLFAHMQLWWRRQRRRGQLARRRRAAGSAGDIGGEKLGDGNAEQQLDAMEAP